MAKARPRIGIVGFGRMAEIHHLDGLRKAGFDVPVVLDITPARRDAALRAGVGLACSDMDLFLETGLQAALITTHSSVRAEVALPLIEAGLHLLIDKPLAVTAPEATAICVAAGRAGVLVSVYHNRRWDADAILVRRLVQEGVLGELIHIENRSFHDGPAVGFGTPDFHQRWRIEASMGGGTLLDFGPHWLDQILSITGERDKVFSVLGDVRHVVFGDADDHFSITMIFESGLRALAGKSDFCLLGPECKWFLLGAKGSAVYRNNQLRAKSRDGTDHTLTDAGPMPDLHRNFLEAIEGRAELLVTARQSLRTCEIIDAARESSRTRRSLDTNI